MSSDLITTTLYIKNMICVNCENTIERLLTGKLGIVSVKASYSSGTVVITYNPNEIDLRNIELMIEEHDYQVQRQQNHFKDKKVDTTVKKPMDLTDIIAYGIIIVAVSMIMRHFGIMNIFNSFPLAKEGMGYGMIFVVGLLTSVHCIAMCGGICLTQCTAKDTLVKLKENKFAALKPSFLYNLGRVISYTVIGGIVGALGSVISFSGTMKGIVQILAGIFMVIMALNMLNIIPWLRKLNPRIPKILAKKINAQRFSNNGPLVIGIINGLMPCGPLQAMQLYALSTGSPIKGAISMFLFSVGTFPLMFCVGALSSFLSRKFTGKMLKASAVLVLLLGLFMFNSGVSLSGLTIPMFSSVTSETQTDNVAVITEGVQLVTSSITSGRYEPITVQKGIPVRWVIKAEEGSINGCNNSIVIPKFGIQKDLLIGDNVIEFTPTDSGNVPFSCWMGMIRSQITVVD